MDPNSAAAQVAQQFSDFYYQSFDNNRTALNNLYRPTSVMTFETGKFTGAEIIEKLSTLPFNKVQHKITTVDAHIIDPATQTLLVMVTGQLLVDDEQNPQYFAQSFVLVKEETSGSYYISHDLFRLNYS
ncbi:Nuclear transport factor 2 [Mycoemilia scoparia]|uniref:Nuclear transport factor 2 n=1 Tax=Mycoemilia scoparia TaxID=417184 RepID=A0A9W7ZWN6_9FUNG|nr:Nuclear transport factor 2 [Mycoemilia scoparia]